MDETTTKNMLGRYRLLRKIGRGGMGEVWLAEDPRLHRQVAIKTLPLHNQDDSEYLRRFEHEARAAAALNHPHILSIHDYGQQQLSERRTIITYIVMPYVSGGTVEDRLDALAGQNTLLAPEDALAYLTQAAEAIDYAHTHGIIHRDIKPANMLLREDNWLLLADFGIARILSDTGYTTEPASGFGTAKYMAPEQARDKAVPASDIYSLAVSAYQFFTGRVPFSGDTSYAITIQHLTALPPSPRQFNPRLSSAFEAVLLSGLAKDPALRPPSAMAYVAGLRQAMDGGSQEDTQALQETGELKFSHQRASTPPTPPTPLPARPAQLVQPAPRSVPIATPANPSNLGRRKLLIGGGALLIATGVSAAAYMISSLGHPMTNLPANSTPGQHGVSTPAGNSTTDTPAFSITGAFGQGVTSMAWSPVTNTLAAYGPAATPDSAGNLQLWKIQTGQSQASSSAQLTTAGNNVLIAWSPNGKYLAVANEISKDTILKDTTRYETLVYKSDLSGLASGFSANTITTTNLYYALCWAANYILTLDVSTDSPQGVLGVCNAGNPRQKIQGAPVLVGTQNTLPSYSSILPFPAGMSLIAASPDGSVLALGTLNGVLVGKFSITGTRLNWQPQHLLANDGYLHHVGTVAWSADGHYLAVVTSGDSNNTSFNQYFGVLDATRNYQVVATLDKTKVQGNLTTLAWSGAANSMLLAAAGDQGYVYLWDMWKAGAPVRILPGILLNGVPSSATALAWSYDGQWLAASYNDPQTSILVWRIESSHG